MNTIPIEFDRQLYKYIYNFCSDRDVFVRRIGGMPDHVHILCDIPPKYAVANFIKVLKSESSKFLKINKNFPNWCGWAVGYAAFSVDASLRNLRCDYIMHQKQHHVNTNFEDEYRSLMSEQGLCIDRILGDDE